MRKGKEAKLVFMGHALMENRNGLLMDFVVNGSTGTAERDAVPGLLDDARERISSLTRRNWALVTMVGNAFSRRTGSAMSLAFMPQSNVPV